MPIIRYSQFILMSNSVRSPLSLLLLPYNSKYLYGVHLKMADDPAARQLKSSIMTLCAVFLFYLFVATRAHLVKIKVGKTAAHADRVQ